MGARRPVRGKGKGIKSGCIFNSTFEEKMTCEYIVNLINSKFLRHKPREFFEFVRDVVGQDAIVALLAKRFPETVEHKDFNDWLEWDGLGDNLPCSVIVNLIRKELPQLILKRLKALSSRRDGEMERRLMDIGQAFNLTGEEIQILGFFFVGESCQVIDAHLLYSNFIDFKGFQTFRSHGHILLGLRQKAFIKGLTRGNLFKAEVLEKSHDSISLSSWCSDFLSGMGAGDLAHEFFTKENDESLKVSDFDLAADELKVLESLLKSSGRQNILLYGAPGTGKTSFTRSLAKKYGRELYTVKVPEDDRHQDRLKAILATVNLADKGKSIVLVDEADEVLNSCKSFFFESRTNKSWINNFLESHDRKVIWITNRSSEIDPSTMRRFSFSMEFKKLDDKRRLKILRHELAKKGMTDYFDEEDMNHLCKSYNVDAGGIVNAISALNISRRMKRETALRKITTVLKNHEKATGGKKGANVREREFGSYSLEGLNTSHSLKDIVTAVAKFNRLRGKDETGYNHALNILLYGMPGTGKTEFVYYLGHALEKEVLLKRCSDIQDKYVGETEKNIARAFAEAQEKGAILFFDEADSFFYPRKDATHSWEKDFTNELLTRMESFKGIAMFATNEIDGLDHAAIRRFRFKIEFRPLTPEGNLHFYNSLLLPLVPGDKRLAPEELKSIKGIRNLTPGDFAVAKDQALFMEPSGISHRMMIDSLMNEARHRKGGRIVKGFGA